MCSHLLSQPGGLELDSFWNKVLPLYAGLYLLPGSAAQDASSSREKRTGPPWKAPEHSRIVSLNACKHVAKQQEEGPCEPFLLKLDLSALTDSRGSVCQLRNCKAKRPWQEL